MIINLEQRAYHLRVTDERVGLMLKVEHENFGLVMSFSGFMTVMCTLSTPPKIIRRAAGFVNDFKFPFRLYSWL